MTPLSECLFRRFNDSSGDFVGIRVRGRTSIFETTNPTVSVRGYRDSDRGASVRDTVAEGIDGLRLVVARQSLIVVCPIDADMTINVLAEFLADLGEHGFFTRRPHHFVREVGVHARAVPIQLAEGLGVPVNREAILFTYALEEVPGNPGFISRALCALGKYLKFPLSSRNFGVNPFYINARRQAQIKVLFYALATERVAGTDRAIVRALRTWIAIDREAGGSWVSTSHKKYSCSNPNQKSSSSSSIVARPLDA